KGIDFVGHPLQGIRLVIVVVRAARKQLFTTLEFNFKPLDVAQGIDAHAANRLQLRRPGGLTDRSNFNYGNMSLFFVKDDAAIIVQQDAKDTKQAAHSETKREPPVPVALDFNLMKARRSRYDAVGPESHGYQESAQHQ